MGEMKAGQSLIATEKDIISQRALAEQSRISESELADALSERKIAMQQANLTRSQAYKELESSQKTESELAEQDAASKAELDARKAELRAVDQQTLEGGNL